MSRIEHGEIKPRTEGFLSGTNIEKAAHATTISRLKNLVPERARHALRMSMQKAALTASGLYLMISSGCGNVESPIVPSSVNEPTPIPAPLVQTPTHDLAPLPGLFPAQELKSSSVNAPETTYLESKIVDGLETYGDEKPLTKEQLPELYEKLNSVEQEMRDDTYYGTIFVAKSTYANFRNIMKGESFQAFLKRHENVFNQMVHEQPYPDTNKLSIRRLVVIDKVFGTNVLNTYLSEFIKDSDGGWDFNSRYVPATSYDYYDKDSRIDYGLLQELGHSVLHLPDHYVLDFKTDDQLPQGELEDSLPVQFREYRTSLRKDLGGDLMSNPGAKYIGLHTNLQLLRRIERKDVHNNKKNIPETSWSFPYEIPQTITFSFGKEHTDAYVKIFRTDFVDPNDRRKKTLKLVDTYLSTEDGELILTKDKLFRLPQNDYNLLYAHEATLLFKITGLDGEHSYRWLDIRDFNIPYWQGHRDHVTMSFNLASEKDEPNSFDWTIKYSP